MPSHFSRVWLFAILWTIARQASLSVEFSRQECWSGLPCPPPGDLPDSGIGSVFPAAPALQVDSLPLSHQYSWAVYIYIILDFKLQLWVMKSRSYLTHALIDLLIWEIFEHMIITHTFLLGAFNMELNILSALCGYLI